MSEDNSARMFQCSHCGTGIQIPINLPPTTAPCPKCGENVTSPLLEAAPVEQVERLSAAVTPPAEACQKAVPQAAPVPAESVEVAAAAAATAAEPAKGAGKLKLVAILAGVVAVFLLVAVGLKIFFSKGEEPTEGKPTEGRQSLSPKERRDNAYRTRGWIEEAEEVLNHFLTAETIEERAAWTIRGSIDEAEMAAVYQEFEENAHRTPVSIFSPVMLDERDSKRGIFLLTYNRPEQFTIRNFFRPIPPMRVKYGLEKPNSWLVAEAAVNNFVDRPIKILAFFAKTPEGLRLDWQTYVQTKFRLLNQFAENPEPGKRGVFRVFIQEDVDLNGRDDEGSAVFRFSDPANREDFAKVLVQNDSELGRVLAPLKWRNKVVTRAPVRNATVSLVWSNDPEPKLEMGELICWEFLDLGGVRGNWKKDLSEQ